MKERQQTGAQNGGVSLRWLNIGAAVVILAVSVVLLAATYRTTAGYERMRESTERLITQRLSAHELEAASDYLTEQARYFAVSGQRQYLNNYFREVEVTRRRDRALETLAGTMAEEHLRVALKDSRQLEEREYYSMRLVAESIGDSLTAYPADVREVKLSRADEALSPVEKRELALSILMDDEYRTVKEEIREEISLSLGALMEENERNHEESAESLREQIYYQQSLIILVIVLVLCVLATTTVLVIRPLLHAVDYIQDEKPVPVSGANEFRFMASTYNRMFKAHQELENRLSYDANHDPLTGAYNRRGYDALLGEVDIARSALLLADVDLFKQINDTCGHEIGDRVLERVVTALSGNFRSVDHICRLGGDEFAVILANVNRDRQEAVRRKIEEINALLAVPQNDLPPVSISVGVAYGEEGADAETLYLRADEALYNVKSNGRRGCAFYRPS